MARVLSCGVLLVDECDELLLCHTTGTSRWDIPKGCSDEGEAPLRAAVRELSEETGLHIDPTALVDLGEFAYLPAKQLHLFACRVRREDVDLSKLSCSTTCTHVRTGTQVPEVDAFDWKPLSEVPQWCGRNLARVLGSLGLPSRLARAALGGVVSMDEADVTSAPPSAARAGTR